jgi:hypothetical protein
MINEKEYTFTKYDDDDEGVEVKGKISHPAYRLRFRICHARGQGNLTKKWVMLLPKWTSKLSRWRSFSTMRL